MGPGSIFRNFLTQLRSLGESPASAATKASYHSGITLDIVQTDAVVDLLAEAADVAVRAGLLKSSSLAARKLGETALTIVAAPSLSGALRRTAHHIAAGRLVPLLGHLDTREKEILPRGRR